MEYFKTLITVLLLTFLIAACGGGGSSSSSSKNLFSLWKADNGDFLDLNGLTFGINQSVVFLFPGGAQCGCNASIIGVQSEGNYGLSSCTFVAGSGSPTPNCAALNQSGTYRKTNEGLVISRFGAGDTLYK